MTYNFDPERWLENRRDLLRKQLRAGLIDREAFERESEALEERYHRMCARLDNTYRLPE